ncbi:MAG: polysaccharide biosynthesis/export family protein [Pseudomonadota bacterium]
MRIVLFAVLALFAAVSAHAQGYTVTSGDRLTIEVLEDPALNRDVVVLPDGTINFPFAGTVPVAGRTVEQIRSSITGGIASNFASQPNVFVTVSAVQPRVASVATARTIDVFFLGEVNTPGSQAVPRGTTFLQALAIGGGLTPFAADKRVQLRRINPKTGAAQLVKVNYRALTRGGDLSRDIVLADGDVILVPSRGLFE